MKVSFPHLSPIYPSSPPVMNFVSSVSFQSFFIEMQSFIIYRYGGGGLVVVV